jgi:subtilase family serine protease
MAPHATLYLVEAQSNSDSDLFCAVTVASNLVAAVGGGEVSMSWGGGEFPDETLFDAVLTTPNVVYFASSGDSPGVIYPSASPNVVSVGGSSISRDPILGSFINENTWQEAGAGPSLYEPMPAFQTAWVSSLASTRITPDVVADANPDTGVWVANSTYESALGAPPGLYWFTVGGTSVASPTVAGIINAAGSFAASSSAENNIIYPSRHFRDITKGDCGPYMGYSAATSFDVCTMNGSPSTYAGK